ncbi:ATP synthase F1 subunit epsilon [Planctomycetota bacterium]|nr:ATP synthase F1 subunit epsilon [Planctomycetota bacterium]
MQVSVVTPDATFFQGEARQVILPATDGEMGILSGHAPLIGVLGYGVVRIAEPNKDKKTLVAVYGGFVKVQDDQVNVLAGGAATAEGTVDEARKAVEEAQKALSAAITAGDAAGVTESTETLKRARARLSLQQLAA